MTTVHVTTPSRLHFGLLRLHATANRGYGGLGLMITQPRVELRVAASAAWDATGPGAQRATNFAKQALNCVEAADRPKALQLHVVNNIPEHRGLGGGTQLALAVAAAARELVGSPAGTAAELAAMVGRGQRSAVGSHGFAHGGLIWERGQTSAGAETLAELTTRVAAPEAWRIVLVAPPRGRGLSGLSEHAAFDRLPQVPADVTSRLESLAEQQILPAAGAADLQKFGEAVYEYGRLSGECFASVQGGPYASADIAACVSAIRVCGICGVGQSSWGPTVYAITSNDAAANELVATLRQDPRWRDYEIAITAPDNRGAVIARVTSSS
jgi:beta-ribofuranosylaminobenzene 5'-phosphate synthase